MEDQVASVKGLRGQTVICYKNFTNFKFPLTVTIKTTSPLMKELIAVTSYHNRKGLVEKGYDINEYFWTLSSSPSK